VTSGSKFRVEATSGGHRGVLLTEIQRLFFSARSLDGPRMLGSTATVTCSEWAAGRCDCHVAGYLPRTAVRCRPRISGSLRLLAMAAVSRKLFGLYILSFRAGLTGCVTVSFIADSAV
jgi:hypothetical protein